MTDRDKLISLLDEFGIGYSIGTPSEDVFIHSYERNVEGYSNSFCHFTFDDESGKFSRLGIWG